MANRQFSRSVCHEREAGIIYGTRRLDRWWEETGVSGHGEPSSTTGAGCFAEGPRLSAKPLRPSAKSLPSTALSKAPSAKIRSAKASLLRAVYRALGKAFAEWPTLGNARNKKYEKTWIFLIGGEAHCIGSLDANVQICNYVFFRKWKRLPASASPHTAFALLHRFNNIADDSRKQEMQKLWMALT
jgi:hypothetical protein